MPTPQCQWLKNAEAAKALAVSERRIKHWTARPETREALGAVRHGKQCRIPRPDNLDHWCNDTRWRLGKLGIQLKPAWERDLKKIDRRNTRLHLESCRFWVAATMKALERRDLTENARGAVDLLWQVAIEILDPLPRHEMQVDRLKIRFPAHLRARSLSDERVNSVMCYWPEKKHFKGVRAAHTLKALEAIRRRLDCGQAIWKLQQSGQKPTAELVRPLLHEDIMAHMNDTGQKLPGRVIKPETPHDWRRMVDASVYLTNQQRAGMVTDLRKPQDGLTLRTFRRRHPVRESPYREIVAAVSDARDSIPGTDETPRDRKTPVRDSTYLAKTRSG